MSTPANNLPAKLPYHPAYKQTIAAVLSTFTYGDIIDHGWLYNEFGIVVPVTGNKQKFQKIAIEYMVQIEGLKEELLEKHSMKLVSVYAVGYKIIMPSEHSAEAMSTLKSKVSKEIKKAVNTLRYVNENMLTQAEIQEKDANVGKIAAVTAFSKNRLT